MFLLVPYRMSSLLNTELTVLYCVIPRCPLCSEHAFKVDSCRNSVLFLFQILEKNSVFVKLVVLDTVASRSAFSAQFMTTMPVPVHM